MNDLEQRWHRELRALEERIDPATSARLAAARRRALEQGSSRRPRWLRPRWLAPAAGLAFACMLSLWVMAPQRQLPGPGADQSLPGAEPPELYEHLDFYSWLANSQWEHDQG